jgi:hypothetical protein
MEQTTNQRYVASQKNEYLKYSCLTGNKSAVAAVRNCEVEASPVTVQQNSDNVSDRLVRDVRLLLESFCSQSSKTSGEQFGHIRTDDGPYWMVIVNTGTRFVT